MANFSDWDAVYWAIVHVLTQQVYYANLSVFCVTSCINIWALSRQILELCEKQKVAYLELHFFTNSAANRSGCLSKKFVNLSLCFRPSFLESCFLLLHNVLYSQRFPVFLCPPSESETIICQRVGEVWNVVELTEWMCLTNSASISGLMNDEWWW